MTAADAATIRRAMLEEASGIDGLGTHVPSPSRFAWLCDELCPAAGHADTAEAADEALAKHMHTTHADQLPGSTWNRVMTGERWRYPIRRNTDKAYWEDADESD